MILLIVIAQYYSNNFLANILIFVFVFKSGDNNIIYETFTCDILF